MKQTRLNKDNLLLNAAAFSIQLTETMPSSELTDAGKTYLAHMLALHAIGVEFGTIDNEAKDLIGILSTPKVIDDMSAILRDLERISQQWTTPVKRLYLEVQALFTWAWKNKELATQVYAYTLLRIGGRGFQHYSRRLKLLIPPKDVETIKTFKKLMGKAP